METMPIKHKPYGDMTIEDVRALVKEVREEGLKIQSHYKRLEQEYSDWEDRVNELDKVIAQAEKETGLTKEEIYETPNEASDIDLDGVDLDDFSIGDLGNSEVDKNESVLDI